MGINFWRIIFLVDPSLMLSDGRFLCRRIVACLWRWKRPAYAFLLLWFLAGIIPSLVTGATANTTRNLAALPAVYILPASGLLQGKLLRSAFNLSQRTLLLVGSAIWLLIAGMITIAGLFSFVGVNQPRCELLISIRW